MKLLLGTKIVLFVIGLVLVNTAMSTLGAAFLNFYQTSEQIQKQLTHALTRFERRLTFIVSELDHDFTTFSQKAQVARYIMSGIASNSLSVSRSADFMNLGPNSKLDRMAFYFPMGFTGPETLQIQYARSIGGVVHLEEDGAFILNKLNDRGRYEQEEVNDPQIFPSEYQSSVAYTLAQRASGPTLIANYKYQSPVNWKLNSFDSGNGNGSLNKGAPIGSFLMEKPLGVDLSKYDEEMGVFYTIFDATGKKLIGQIELPRLNLEDAPFDKKTVISMADLNGHTYDSLVLPLIHKEIVMGYVATHISQEDTFQKVLETILVLVGIAALVGAFLVLLSFILVRFITNPIASLSDLLKDIAEGEGNLTQRLKIHTRDELGQMAHWFNLFISKVHEIIKEIQSTSNHLSSAAEELLASSVQMRQNSDSISGAITKETNAVHENIKSITNTTTSLGLMFERIKSVQNIANEAENVAVHGNDVMARNTQTMTNIKTNQKKIEGVINIITEIANQINLLSLNAAIEAAKAGESGKGFAVVADEIRNLADRSGQAVVEIQLSIDAGNQSIEDGAHVIHETQETLDTIIHYVQKISNDLNQLATGITEQEYHITEVSTRMMMISDLSDENDGAVKEMTTSLAETAQTSDGLNDLAEELMDHVGRFKV